MQDLRLDDFAAWVGEECEVAGPEGQAAMILALAEPLQGGVREAGAFRLEFLGPVQPIFNQAIMAVTRPGFAQDIFLVPIASDAAGTRYEAVFY